MQYDSIYVREMSNVSSITIRNCCIVGFKDDPDLASLLGDLVAPCFQVLFTISG